MDGRALRGFLGKMAQIAVYTRDKSRLADFEVLYKIASTHSGTSSIDWTPEQITAFERVKSVAASADFLVPFDPSRQLYLLVDACDVGYGGWLAHLHEGATTNFEPISTFSGKWSDAELNYTIPEKEITAIRVAAERHRYEMLGRMTVVFCDNSAVVQILANGSSSPVARLRNTAAELMGFHFVVRHLPSSLNSVADAFSRDPRFSLGFDLLIAARVNSALRAAAVGAQTPLRIESVHVAAIFLIVALDYTISALTLASTEYLAPALADTREALRRLVQQQGEDDEFALIRRVAAGSERPNLVDKDAWRAAEALRPTFDPEHQNALFVAIDGARRLAVPDGSRSAVVAQLHGEAHICAADAIKLARRLFWWPTMTRDIRQTVLACAQCQRINADRRQAPGNLGDVEAGRTPARAHEWELDSFDCGATLGSFRVVAVLERYSGCVFSLVVETASADDAYAAYCTLIVRPHGHPRSVCVDNGTEFLGVFDEELRKAGVAIVRGLPENHHHVARLERSNRDRLNRLTHMYLANSQVAPRDAAEMQRWLDTADAAHNATPTLSGYSPHELLTGRQRLISLASLVPDNMLQVLDGDATTKPIGDSVRLHRAALAVLDDARMKALREARAAIERAHGAHHADAVDLLPGDLVLVRTPSRERDGADKVTKRLQFSGVWRVQSYDAERLAVVVKPMMPVPRYTSTSSDVAPIELDHEITVHVSDVRHFIEATPIDSDRIGAPFDAGQPLLGQPFLNVGPDDNSGQADYELVAARAMKAAVSRMLSSEQQARISDEIEKAFAELERRAQASLRDGRAPPPQRAPSQRRRAQPAGAADRPAPEEERRDESEAAKAPLAVPRFRSKSRRACRCRI